MREKVQVAVIGGGVVGCSVLYHLTKLGWKDVTLIERSELTSGSTWHAAGGFHTLNGDPNVAKLQSYTIQLYKEIEEISGQSCGLHTTGGVMLAGTPERMDFLKLMHAKGKYLGMNTRLITPDEAHDMMPILDPQHFVGALYDEFDGHLDPSGTTHAYAKSARIGGAEIVLRNRVLELNQRQDGTWDVVTEQGTMHAEHVVNAGGLWAREVGRMVGLELPVLAMEHMYLLTEDMPEVAEINKNTGKEVLHAIDFEGEIYLRQERGGMLMGTYEKAGVPWSTKQTPWEFGHELLEPDIERIAPSLEVGFKHFPAFERAGIKQIINGPFTFAPDGNPVIGPVRGLKNYWCACGVMAGFSQGGGVGLALSNWIVNGDPGFDCFGMDVARFGDYATMAYTRAKVYENYTSRFSIRFPNEELPAARPLKTTPLYDTLSAKNAVWGVAFGLEYPLWFAPEGMEPIDDVSFRRSNSFDPVKRECELVRNCVGMIETASFAKYEVTGPGAAEWLDHVLAGRVPKPGRMSLSPMLDNEGGLIGDFTMACLGENRYFIFGSGPVEVYHMRWFEKHLPDSGVEIRAHGLDLCGLSIAGPKSRELLSRVTDEDVSAAAFKFMDIREMDIGLLPAIVGRVTFTGDLGYEIWVKPQYLRQLYEMLMEQGADLGLDMFGSRALRALSLEKGFGTLAREFRPIYTAHEAGFDRFIPWDKKPEDFIGRKAALEKSLRNDQKRMILLEVAANDAEAIGDEPVYCDDKIVGWVTSGGYGGHVNKSLALAYVDQEVCEKDSFTIELLGENISATRCAEPPFDPAAERMRG